MKTLIQLSAYTIASNCTDITDCNYGIEEILEGYEKYRKMGKFSPKFFDNRLEKLEAKRDKFSMKQYGMKYNQYIATKEI